MILLYRLLEIILKVVILVLIIAFERVVGFPVLFLTVSISFMLISKLFTRYLLFIFSSFLLAIFYQIGFIFSFIIIALFYLGFTLGSSVLESNLNRFMFFLLLSNGVLSIFASIEIQVFVLVQAIISLIISTIFLIKFLFIRYGFLGTKKTASISFFK